MNSPEESAEIRQIEYLSPATDVNMSDGYFQIARTDHFWVRRRFEVLQKLAGEMVSQAVEIAEVGCGHGLLQRQVEDTYGKPVTGFDLNVYGLKHNVSRISRVCCYDINQKDEEFRGEFDLILLFDVLEHIPDEDSFLQAILFHLAPEGTLVMSVPAGEWAFSSYDRAAGHVRRYSIQSLRKVVERNILEIKKWSYWGLPMLPTLVMRKLRAEKDEDARNAYAAGFDTRTKGLNEGLAFLSKCELIPQRLAGTSVMTVLQRR